MILNPRKCYSYFNSQFVLKASTLNWWAFDCPFCVNGSGKAKMAVHFGWEICKCWSCGYRDYVTQFVMDTQGCTYFQAKDMLNHSPETKISLDKLEGVVATEVSDVLLPKGFRGIMEDEGAIGTQARKYLTGRGFDLEWMDKLGFGYCDEHHENKNGPEDYFGYIIIPFWSRGKLAYYQGRDFTGNYLRYKNPAKDVFGVGKSEFVFNEDALQMRKKVYVTEGWADAMTMGDRGVSTQGWSFSKIQHSKFMGAYSEELVFLPDAGNDGEGRSFYKMAVKMAMNYMDSKKVKVVDLNGHAEKDANEFGRTTMLAMCKQVDYLTMGTALGIIC